MSPSAATPLNMEDTSIVTKGQHTALKIDLFSNYTNWIDGKPSTTAQTRHGINPATKEALPEVPCSTEEDVENAVAAARMAFKSWKEVPYEERAKAVTAFGNALEAMKDDFAKLLTTEQGKPVSCRPCWRTD